MDQAGLWTDGRYFIQAANQLEGTGIDLMKMGQPETPSIPAYILAFYLLFLQLSKKKTFHLV